MEFSKWTGISICCIKNKILLFSFFDFIYAIACHITNILIYSGRIAKENLMIDRFSCRWWYLKFGVILLSFTTVAIDILLKNSLRLVFTFFLIMINRWSYLTVRLFYTYYCQLHLLQFKSHSYFSWTNCGG